MKGYAGRPRLRGAGDGIARGPEAGRAGESAEELGHARAFPLEGRVEQGAGQRQEGGRAAVAPETGGGDGVSWGHTEPLW
jgi:hypothetical protein